MGCLWIFTFVVVGGSVILSKKTMYEESGILAEGRNNHVSTKGV